MNNKQQIIDLYQLYNFKNIGPDNEVLTFIYEDGYFTNVEILKLENCDVSIIKDDYESLGYSVKISEFSTLEELHSRLFKGFFRTSQSNQRLQSEYNKFVDKQKSHLNGQNYKFVPCKYIGNRGLIEADIVNRVYNQLFADGPQLIIIEAAAGYGKTCTSYEIISALANNPRETAPIIAELSKNRQATIFKYVLLDEIEHKFRGLTSNLVISEIKNGNVPLIIDGFDELITKGLQEDGAKSSDAESAQTMLSTIAQLFSEGSNAKIILTSRKTALFSGKEFEEWQNRNLEKCEITRLQLIAPTVEEWIGKEKADYLQSSGVELDDISNPALLAFISTSSMETVQKEFDSSTAVIHQYFKILLLRERERQQLLLTPAEQIDIMQSIALQMMNFNYTSCTTYDLRALIELIISDKIYEYLKRYEDPLEDNSTPSQEEFINKLIHHALLDRIQNSSNSIGFINYFIFGYLLIQRIIERTDDSVEYSKIDRKYWDIMVIAGKACQKEIKVKLFDTIIMSGIMLQKYERLELDLSLRNHLTQNYSDEYFESIRFSPGTDFSKDYQFEKCVFSWCSFNGCTIYSHVFRKCNFYNCQFYETKVVRDTDEDLKLYFINCNSAELLIQASNTVNDKEENSLSDETWYEKKVLEQYWRPGSDHSDKRRLYETLFKGVPQQEYDSITSAIQRLLSEGILISKSNYIELNFSKMKEIRQIIGRGNNE